MIVPEIRADERGRFFYVVGAFICVATSALIARTLGDTLFLTRFGADRLPLMYFVTALLIAVLAFTYGNVIRRRRLVEIVVAGGSMFVALTIAFRFLLNSNASEVRVGIYIFSELVVRLPLLLFWTYALLLFDVRQAKRLLGLVGAAGTMACMAAGALIPTFVHRLGTENLLWVQAALLALFVALVAKTPGLQPRVSSTSRTALPIDLSYYGQLLRGHQVRMVAALVAVSAFTLLVNDYIFKTAARAHFSGRELASFFGSFYSWASVGALVLQLFVVHQLLKRGGLGLAIKVLPVFLLILSALVVITGSFSSIVAAKFAEPLLDFTINAGAVQMLYLGIQKRSRDQVRALADGVCRPMAMAVAGIVLFLVARHINPQQLAVAVLAGAALWLWLATRNHHAYTAGLTESIGARRLDLSHHPWENADLEIAEQVRASLRAADDDDVPYLLALLSSWGDVDWRPEVRSLLQRPNPDVKIGCLEYLVSHGKGADIDVVRSELRHDDARVRRIALTALAHLDKNGAADSLKECIRTDADRGVRAVAAIELLNCGEGDDLALARTKFDQMLSSTDAADRRAALDAAKGTADASIICAVAALVADPETGSRAAEVLSTKGAGALDALTDLTADALQTPAPAYARRLPALFAQIGTPGLNLLQKLIDGPDLQLRRDAILAWCEIASRGEVEDSGTTLDRLMRRETAAARTTADLLASIDSDAASQLLILALTDQYRRHCECVLHLLQLDHPTIESRVLFDYLTQSNQRQAEALELLDTLLPARMKEIVLPLFEERAKRKTGDVATTLRATLEGNPSEWVVIGAIYCIGERRLTDLRGVVETHLDHRSGHVQQTAADALGKLDVPGTIGHTHEQGRSAVS